MPDIMTLLILFWEFFKTGLFAIGGGMATLPFLYDMAARFEWFSAAELTDMIAIAESTPGPIGINAATYGGFQAAGVLGGIVATFGIVLPSFIIILVIARLMQRYYNSPAVKGVFETVRPATTGLIAAAGLTMVFTAVFGVKPLQPLPEIGVSGWAALAITAVSAGLSMKFKWHPVVFVGAGALIGIALGFSGVI